MTTVLLLAKSETPAFKAIAECILSLAKERGWAAHAAVSDASSSTADALVRTWNPDGCIIYAPRPGSIGTGRGWHVPSVLVSPATPSRVSANVSHDSRSTGCLAARELAGLGLDTFAFAASDNSLPWVRSRLAGFSAELARRGREPIVFEGGSLRRWLESLPKPCGLFAANDLTAEKAVAAASAAGIEIPFDLAVLGCDDDARICEHAEVTISSIRPDYLKCAMLATDSLAATMAGKRTPAQSLFGDSGVTRRASTRMTARRSPEISAALEFIRGNAFSGITAADVLATMKRSRRSAEMAFRAATGRSIVEEIQNVRLEEAKRLLSNPFVKAGAVAGRVGYTSENFLIRLFRRETGMTPSEWRASRLSAK